MHDLLMGLCQWLETSPWGAATRVTHIFYPYIRDSSILPACPYGWAPTLRWMYG